MGRKNRMPTTYDLFIIGEQLRVQMTRAGLIKDQRHHLRKHRLCFVAKDAIDWMLKMCHVDTRQDAVDAMTILQEFSVIHHVTDDQEFKDKNTYFRFTKDNDSYKTDRELKTFYRGLEIHGKLKEKGQHVMRDFYHKGELHKHAFYGSDLVDFLQESEGVSERGTVVGELQDLLARDVIKHLTDDYHFSDDRLIYEFSINFHKPCLVNEVLHIMESFSSLKIDKEGGTAYQTTATEDTQIPDDVIPGEADDEMETSDSSDADDTNSVRPIRDKNDVTSQKRSSSSGLNSERVLMLQSDSIGYGFVLRGCAPCCIQAVDPLGPASKARVKVGQAVSSVNGQDVYHKDHRQVGRLIAQCEGEGSPLKLGVTTHRRQTFHS